MSFVYFISAAHEGNGGWGRDSYLKIGVAADPVARLVAMQTGSPLTLNLEFQIPGDTKLESSLHKYFSENHIRGEWFHYGHDMERPLEIIKRGDVAALLDPSPWSDKFKRILASRGVSLEEFCVDTGIKLATLERLFNGQAHPTTKTRRAITDFTGDLITDRDFERAIHVVPSLSLVSAKKETA